MSVEVARPVLETLFRRVGPGCVDHTSTGASRALDTAVTPGVYFPPSYRLDATGSAGADGGQE
ncbi:MAG: hypothetical protein LH630_05270, partial [Actinomycetia bacterium]|nr:hypothetical protein [Actinomycetes bacterium]